MTGFGNKGGFGGNKGNSRKKGRSIPYKNPHKDPMSDLGEPTGDLEKDTAEEVEAIGEAFAGFKKRMDRESKRFEFAVDASYWSGICFRSVGDRQKFFDAIGMGDKLYRGQHIDGYEMARHLGLDIDFEYPIADR